MDFTEIYKQTSSLVAFSPGAQFILTAVQDRLVVRRSDTLTITRTWPVDASPSATETALSNSKPKSNAPGSSSSLSNAWITHIGWACDSEYILAACAKRGVVNVFKIRDEDWSARIESGAEGLVKAEWAPDGRTVLCFSAWGLRVTIWSLVSGTATYIQFPVHADRGYAFRADGRYFILAERHKSRETLGLYDTEDSYKLVRHYPLPTASLSSLSVSPTGNHVAVWEGPLEYKLYILTLAGEILASFSPDPDPGLGIRSVAWHPGGAFLAVGGWDDKIYMLDSLSWSPVAVLELPRRIPAGIATWREPTGWFEATQGRGFLSFERLQGSQTIPVTRPDLTKAHPKNGVIQLQWNKSGTCLMARFENAPSIVNIYSFPTQSESFVPKLRSVLILSNPVLQAHWNPVRAGSLAACCGNRALYTWSDEWVGESGEEEEMAECIGVPAKKLDVREVKWAPDGKGLLLLDKDTFCCAFEVEADDENGGT
ncbi:YVTN repeat-like/Quino protein amine dehydrogenase [Gloeophyllum trabeum ATCC 11539]|uniref:YVTN repeat-like/Quino protein amine dehydrogenase n=1 Tax=Gloeophyllum trabeum (strain ATCC 11539 / FP-39264 / Madison 617) TaxID=670483 RepID=S7QMD3_GLOTA|nr:YVTN repeat-like/Quino protein amine dehydrogenase [Gloeophyllum trabeum ATCC 11539]EPQ60552.1 YVTN repeat-like/Quino protein amine dehydrogenase [Gloeophyllum trabeum ATCC 11539]